MAGSVAVQVAREEVFESFSSAGGDGAGFEQPCQQQQRSLLRTNFSVETRVDVVATAVEEDSLVADGPTELAAGVDEKVAGGATEARGPAMTVQRHSLLAPYKPGKMTVVLDMDECLLHSKFHGPGAASEAYRQLEERPDAVNEVNSFWVALDDGDTAQVSVLSVEFLSERCLFYFIFLRNSSKFLDEGAMLSPRARAHTSTPRALPLSLTRACIEAPLRCFFFSRFAHFIFCRVQAAPCYLRPRGAVNVARVVIFFSVSQPSLHIK